MSPRPRLPSPRFDFRGGVNTAFTDDVLDSTELRLSQNARSIKGGYARVLGSKRVHAAALAGGKPITGLFQWDAPTGSQVVAIANGQLFTWSEGDADFAAGPTGMSITNNARFATYRQGNTVFLLIADGALWKWDGTTLSNLTTVGAPAAIDLAVYKLRVFAITGSKTVSWSKIGDPTLWQPADGGGTADVETFDTEPLTGLLVVGSSLILAKDENIARFTGTDANDIQIDTGTEGVSNSVGVISPRTLIEIDGGAYAVSAIGPIAISEAGAVHMGAKVSDQFVGEDRTAWAKGLAVRYPPRHEIWVWLPSGAAWIYNEEAQNWSGPILSKPATAACEFISDDGTETFLRGGADGFVRRDQIDGSALEDVLADGTGGVKAPMVLRTPTLLFGAPGAVKRLADGQSIEADLGTVGLLQIGWASELGSGSVSIPTGGAGVRDYAYRLGAKGRRIVLTLTDSTAALVQINGLTPVAALSSSSSAPAGLGPAQIVLTPPALTVAVGDNTGVIQLLLRDQLGTPLGGRNVTVASSNEAVATVPALVVTNTQGQANILITALAEGAAIITVTALGTVVQALLTVASAVDHLVAPTNIALTLALDPVDHLVAPASIALDAPSGGTVGGTPGAITHARFGKTLFGTPGPDQSNQDWAFGPDKFRFTVVVSGDHSYIKVINPNSRRMPYALHHFCEATGQEATEGTGSSWGTLAEEWAAANAADVEDLFLHADVGQATNSAVIASIDATGKITLGFQTGNNKQQLSQARLGAAESNAFIPGQQYTITGNTGVPDGTLVTVTSIPSKTTIQTNFVGPGGTGGSIFRVGDGTKTKANRMFAEGETDWLWSTNPGSAAGKAFQVNRIGLILGANENAVFFDSHSASNMHFKSLEYGQVSNVQYVNDICTLFSLYRAAYPGTIYFPNLANFTTAQDDQMAAAAGGCQMEGALNIFHAGRPNDSIGTTVVNRLAAGVVVELGTTPSFNGATPHAGASGSITTNFRNSGGHRSSTPDDRAMMTCYTGYLCLVDQRTPDEIAAGAMKDLALDPANQFWNVYPLSARWEPAWDIPLGEPVDAVTPPKFAYAAGGGVTVLGRVFSGDGTTNTDLVAIALMRVWNGTDTYDATTNFQVPINQDPPAGKAWGFVDEFGNITGALVKGDLVDMWNIDYALLLAH